MLWLKALTFARVSKRKTARKELLFGTCEQANNVQQCLFIDDIEAFTV